VSRETYHTAGAQHAPMEPHATLARWHEGGSKLDEGAQAPFYLCVWLPVVFDIPDSRYAL